MQNITFDIKSCTLKTKVREPQKKYAHVSQIHVYYFFLIQKSPYLMNKMYQLIKVDLKNAHFWAFFKIITHWFQKSLVIMLNYVAASLFSFWNRTCIYIVLMYFILLKVYVINLIWPSSHEKYKKSSYFFQEKHHYKIDKGPWATKNKVLHYFNMFTIERHGYILT